MEHPDAFPDSAYASFGRRLAAFVIDLVVVALVWFGVIVALAMASSDNEVHLEGLGMLAVWVLTGVVWDAAWITGPWRGKPGQLLAGFRVVRPDGARVGVGKVGVRTLVRMATFLVFPFGLIAQGLTVAASRRNQAVHDTVVDTVCVRKADIEAAGSVQHVPTAAQLGTPTASTPATRSSPIDRGGDEDGPNRGPFL